MTESDDRECVKKKMEIAVRGKRRKEGQKRKDTEGNVMLFASCLSTNTHVSTRTARELIMLSQQSSALQQRAQKDGRGWRKCFFKTAQLLKALLG